jgi:putative transposase
LRPVRKRKLVDEVRGEWGVSIRRACSVFEVDTSTYHYKSRRAGQAGLEQRIKDICQTRVRYGYRRVHVLLRREGWAINQKKTRRIYRELGLQLRNKTPKRRVKAKLREDRRNATQPNETWAMDFVHDQLATGRKLRVLTIVDTFSRFSPAEPRLSFRGTDVVEVLERVGRGVGLPATIRVDQGTESVSRDLDLWAYQRGVTLDFSRPGKPTDNAYIEAFNGRFRAEWERPLVPEPCRRPRKDGGLAQVLQRRTPPWGDRPKDADYAAESRWRIQPATVSKPEKSSFR